MVVFFEQSKFVAKCDRNSDEFVLRSLRVGGATTLRHIGTSGSKKREVEVRRVHGVHPY